MFINRTRVLHKFNCKKFKIRVKDLLPINELVELCLIGKAIITGKTTGTI